MIEAGGARVSGWELRGAAALLVPGVAVPVAWLAFDDGAYSATTWTAVAVAVWWALGLAALGVLPVVRVTPAARVTAAALAALGVLALASTAWAADAERAYAEAGEIALYLGVFLLVSLLARAATVGRWLDGLALGIVAIGLLALASRLFPSLGLGRGGGSVLPAVVTRLSYPLGYWNGLAVFVALAVPLLLRTAVSARAGASRAVAVGVVPLLAADVYLSSSRGGAIVLAVGALAFLFLSGRPWASVGALLCALVGAAVAVAALHARPALVDGPVTSAAASSQGRSAAAILVAAAVLAALLWLALSTATERLRRPSRAFGQAVTALAVLAVAVAVVAAHPVARFDAFKRPPVQPNAPAFTATHLLSGSGSGRWQFWSSAVDEWHTARLLGKGAGSYAAWWAQHGTLPMPVHDAHSVLFQALAELGALGLILVVLAWIGGPLLALAGVRRLDGDERIAAAAAAAAAAGFAVGAALDWVWELPVVTVVGMAALALAFTRGNLPGRVAPAWRIAAALPLAVVAFELVPLATALALDQSRRAAQVGDTAAARTAALRAHALEPWALSPLEQLALVDEADGALATAGQWIDRARSTTPGDWQVRVIAARIETKQGEVAAARRDLDAARRLAPRSPLFAASP